MINKPTTHSSSEIKPVTLLAGGSWHSRNSPDPLLCDCLSQAQAKSPTVAYIGAASGDDRGFFNRLAASFQDTGAGTVTLVPLASSSPDIAAAHAILTEADIIFISGGDVREGMHCLERHNFSPFLRQLHKTGKPFFGLSAGSIMLSQCWIHWDNPDDDATAGIFQCLELAPVLCDTHAEDDDWQELKMLLHLLPEGQIGYGIPTGGGLQCIQSNVSALGKPLQRFQRIKDHIRKLTPLTPLV